MSSAEWEIIFKYADLITYKEGEIIINQGESKGKLYQIASGLCRVEKTVAREKKILARLGRGKIAKVFLVANCHSIWHKFFINIPSCLLSSECLNSPH